MTDLIYPTAHELCAACGCHWDTDLFGEPNRQLDSCDSCACHSWEFAESRTRATTEDALEAAWREAGYADSMAVWQVEQR